MEPVRLLKYVISLILILTWHLSNKKDLLEKYPKFQLDKMYF